MAFTLNETFLQSNDAFPTHPLTK